VGFEAPDRLEPDGPDLTPDRDEGSKPSISLAPAAAAFAVFTVLRGLLPFLDAFVSIPRGLGAVLLLAAGASGVALVVVGTLQIWRAWGL
jgi:hypothetical protein